MEEQQLYLLITRYLSSQSTTEENELLADWIVVEKKNEQTFEEIKLIWLKNRKPVEATGHYTVTNLKAKIIIDDSQMLEYSQKSTHVRIAASLFVIMIGAFLAYPLMETKLPSVILKETTISVEKKKIIFKNEPLRNIVSVIEKMYSVKVIFTDQAAADMRIFIEFNEELLHEVMESICASGRLEYRQTGSDIYITLKTEKSKTD